MALEICALFYDKSVVESDLIHAISLVSPSVMLHWRFHFYLNEIKMLSSSIEVEFGHVGQMANGIRMADSSAKQGVDRSSLVELTL